MEFSLRSPKLFGGPAETRKILRKLRKFQSFRRILWRFRRFLRKEMLTLSGDSGDFCGVSRTVLKLTASFWVRSLLSIFRDSGT
jgi:hypothetical protein